MHILITGAARMLGPKLAARLAQDGRLGGHEITRMTLVDLVPPEAPRDFRGPITELVADMARPGTGTQRPSGFVARRVRDLGLVAEDDFEQIIRAHIQDEQEDRT